MAAQDIYKAVFSDYEGLPDPRLNYDEAWAELVLAGIEDKPHFPDHDHVSGRWEVRRQGEYDDTAKAWVEDVAAKLRERGLIVEFAGDMTVRRGGNWDVTPWTDHRYGVRFYRALTAEDLERGKVFRLELLHIDSGVDGALKQAAFERLLSDAYIDGWRANGMSLAQSETSEGGVNRTLVITLTR